MAQYDLLVLATVANYIFVILHYSNNIHICRVIVSAVLSNRQSLRCAMIAASI